MLPHALLLALAAAAGALQTRETVERVVLLRTSGSDLAPAATGYIYHKQDDGRESLVHMGESEVMRHLAAGERVIPVREPAEPVDGVADVDYRKMFADHGAPHGAGRAYDDYLDSLKRFKESLRREYGVDGGDSVEADRGAEHRSGGGDAGSYRDAKFESYSISGGRGDGHDRDKHYGAHQQGSDEEGRAGGDRSRGFHELYENYGHEYKGKAFPDEHKYYGAGGRGHAKYGSDEPQHRAAPGDAAAGDGDASAERQAAPAAEQQSAPAAEQQSGGGVDGAGGADAPAARGYGYDIKH